MLDLMTLYTTQQKQYVYAGPTKAIQGQYSTRVRLGNKELILVKEFRYLGHVITADCRDDKNIKK